ncbi:Aspartate transaminase [Syntrophobotulus glycolicus DSM 8271]|uniref:Aminotransferase n=1 Tax=Syntrophobotulus glycolicus (strain DSM 8271 / FlGlyR) TaxID=645991 RepID=F0SYZ3_SYNGF|nr:aminotransferase class I/II-fold pyridoxal phosphate-dependent enzyme [Syntrophobotulus glycolicus]ADY56030.1 Aspartate transaminase [Syntrophobotulus glycolicus DSM 8271]
MKKYLSPVAANLKPSGIRKYFDMASMIEDVISLGVGEPDFATPWIMRESAIFSIEQGQTMYTSNAGLIELRRELSKYLAKHQGLEYDPENELLVTVGASESIDLALRALITPGDGILIPDPSYVSYAACASLAGAEVYHVPLREENNFRLQVEDLQMVYTPNCKILILSYPNNPTGAVMTRNDLLPIARFASENNLIVISDEIYSDLTYEGTHTPFASLPFMRNRTLHISGFSKSHAMTGWRVGYAAGHPDIIQTMTRIHQYTILCAPIMAQIAALEALRSGESAKSEMVLEYDRRRRLLLHGYKEMGLTCFEPLGAFYTFPNITVTGLCSEEFTEQLLKEEKVAVVPGTAFGPCGEGYIRCSYAYSVEQLREALRRMNRFVSRRIK